MEKMKTKILLFALAAVLLASIGTASVLADECAGSGTNILITYSPSDLYVGTEFNLNYYDMFAGANQQVTLSYPSELQMISANATVTLADDGFGGGYYTWRMNSTAPGNRTVYVTAHYQSDCNVTRTITILGPKETPVINLSYILPSGDVIARQTKLTQLIIANTGNATAYNVTGWTNLGSVTDTLTYSQIAANSSVTRDFNISTATCGNVPIESTVNYQNIYGYRYPPSHVTGTLSVIGSDLEIEDFAVSDDSVDKGKTVEFSVSVKNNAKDHTTDATNAKVKIYSGSELLETISLGSIATGNSKSGTAKWKTSGKTGDTTIKAVVESDNACSNYNDNTEASLTMHIRKAEEKTVVAGPTFPEENKTATQTQQTQQQQTRQPAEKAGLGIEMPITTIIIEMIALVFIAVIVGKSKRPRRYPRVPPISKNF